MRQFGIRKVKTWNGVKWGVVDLFTKVVYGLNAKKEKVVLFKPTQVDVVESKAGNIGVALFAYDNEGFVRAKELQDVLNG